MTTGAAQISQALLDALEHIDDGRMPIAEVVRRLGAEAEARRVTRPSYECIRRLVHESRRLRLRRGPSGLQVLGEASAGLRSLGATMDALAAPRDERH
ncbi:MAG TPA: hypothetical protein VMS63_04295 [Gaiellaceae bacterium]|jgi:hypothetical protein|nr:hypothetical protein [Gaiellaceae bacterium]